MLQKEVWELHDILLKVFCELRAHRARLNSYEQPSRLVTSGTREDYALGFLDPVADFCRSCPKDLPHLLFSSPLYIWENFLVFCKMLTYFSCFAVGIKRYLNDFSMRYSIHTNVQKVIFVPKFRKNSYFCGDLYLAKSEDLETSIQ